MRRYLERCFSLELLLASFPQNVFLNNVLLFIGKWERVFRHAIPDPDNAEAFSGAAGELLSKNEEDPRANLYSR